MKTFKRIKPVALLSLAVLLVCAFALSACGGGGGNAEGGAADASGGGETIQLTIGAGHIAEGMVYTRGARDFFCPEVSKRVAERTDYQIEWIDAYGGSIAKMAEILDATEKGLIDVGLPCYPFLSSDLLPHNICYFAPLTTDDTVIIGDAMDKLYAEFPVFIDIFEKDHNQKYLGTGYAGNYQLITKKPIKSLDDVKGVKIAAAGPNLNWLKGTGAVPVQDEMNNAYTSIQSGVYDGWVMFSDSNYRFKLFEVAPYETHINFGAIAVNALTMNMDKFNSLPKEVQDILVEVGAEYSQIEKDMANDTASEADDAMVKEGLTILEFPQAEREKWADLLPNLPQDYIDQMNAKGYPGEAIMQRYLELLNESGITPVRAWL